MFGRAGVGPGCEDCDPGAGAYRFGGGAFEGGALYGEDVRATGGCLMFWFTSGGDVTDEGAYMLLLDDGGRSYDCGPASGEVTRAGGGAPAFGGGGRGVDFCR